MDLKTAKNIGGIGAILTILSVMPRVGWIVSLIGFILVLIAIKTIADAVGENKIFTDYIIAAVLNIISSITLAVGGIAAFLLLLRVFRYGFGGLTAIGIAVVIIGWILSIIGGYFVKSSFDGINQATGEKNFKTAGLFIFIGSILQIILVGFIVSFIGIIFEVIGFFSLPDTLVTSTPEQPTPQEIPPQPPQSV